MKYLMVVALFLLAGCDGNYPYQDKGMKGQAKAEKAESAATRDAVAKALREERERIAEENFILHDIPPPIDRRDRHERRVLWAERFEGQRLCHEKGWVQEGFQNVRYADEENPYRTICTKPDGSRAVFRLKDAPKDE
jgi:hypothetical protein